MAEIASSLSPVFKTQWSKRLRVEARHLGSTQASAARLRSCSKPSLYLLISQMWWRIPVTQRWGGRSNTPASPPEAWRSPPHAGCVRRWHCFAGRERLLRQPTGSAIGYWERGWDTHTHIYRNTSFSISERIHLCPLLYIRDTQIQSLKAADESGFFWSNQIGLAFTWDPTFPGGSIFCLVRQKTRLRPRRLDLGKPTQFYPWS